MCVQLLLCSRPLAYSSRKPIFHRAAAQLEPAPTIGIIRHITVLATAPPSVSRGCRFLFVRRYLVRLFGALPRVLVRNLVASISCGAKVRSQLKKPYGVSLFELRACMPVPLSFLNNCVDNCNVSNLTDYIYVSTGSSLYGMDIVQTAPAFVAKFRVPLG